MYTTIIATPVVVIVLSLASTTNLVLSCPPSSEITKIQDIRLCNGSLLSIKFNVSDSCDNIRANLYRYVYHHNTSSNGTSRINVSWGYSNYSDILCGVTATLGNPVMINVDEFNRTNLLQIRLRDPQSSNETCSNNFHVFLDYTGFLGPPVDIDSNSYNCSNINVTWSDPVVNCGIEPVYYNLSIYDAVANQFLRSVSVNDTNHQFPDDDLFIHRYTYVITGVNELGEGISNNDTFSYQRVPRSVEQTTLVILNYTQNMATVQYDIPVIIECTGEAPENATVTIQCTGTGVVYNDTELIEYERQPKNITGLISVPRYQQCNISIVFSNEAGSSEPFILAFDTTPPPYISSLLPIVSVTPTPGSGSDPPKMTPGAIIGIVFGIIAAIVIVLIVVLVAVLIYCKRSTGKSTLGTGNGAAERNHSNDIQLKEVTKQEDKNNMAEEDVVQDGGPEQKEVQLTRNYTKELVQNGTAGQEDVEQNPMTDQEVQDGTTEEDTALEQGIVKAEVLADNNDTALSKSNTEKIESTDSASDSKKPTEDRHHKDTYNPKHPDPSSSVVEPNIDQSESSAYEVQAEVLQNGEGQDEVQEVLQNPVALAGQKEVVQDGTTEKDTAVRQEVGAVEQDIAKAEVLVDNTDTTTSKSKSNDKKIESADNAKDRSSKKPAKDKYHKDTYNLKRPLLDISTCSSVPEVSHDQPESNAYYDEPIVTGESYGIYKETTDDDRQQPRQFVTHSIPRPITGDRSAIFSATLSGPPVLKESELQASPPSLTKELTAPQQIVQPNTKMNEEDKDFQSEPFDN